jgi:hypothetical protein
LGYNQAHDVNDILAKVRSMVSECNRTNIDPTLAFGVKQDLYLIKDIVEQALKACPEYPQEAEWLKKQDQKKIIKILKGD